MSLRTSDRREILETLFEIRWCSGVKENAIKKGKNMRVTAKTNRKPLELRTKLRHMVIFAQAKYKPYTEILEALKLIQLILRKVKIANVSII